MDDNKYEHEIEEPIIFTNGCFDLLHFGHIQFLQACKALGGFLIVGINSDSSVTRLKGEHRPIISEYERKHALLALECVDQVMVFIEDNPLELIHLIQPDIYVKSIEYQDKNIPEFAAVTAYGGKIKLMQPDEFLENIHTTTIIDKIFHAELKRRTTEDANNRG